MRWPPRESWINSIARPSCVIGCSSSSTGNGIPTPVQVLAVGRGRICPAACRMRTIHPEQLLPLWRWMPMNHLIQEERWTYPHKWTPAYERFVGLVAREIRTAAFQHFAGAGEICHSIEVGPT